MISRSIVMVLGLGFLVSVSCQKVKDVSCDIKDAANNIKASVLTSAPVDAYHRSSNALRKTWQDITPEQEYYIGRSVTATVLQTYEPFDDPNVNAYVNLLGQSLAIFSECPETFGGYHFLLLDSKEVNAFAAPGGFILITRGMVECCENEDELAAVLAHEISHVAKRHGLAAIRQGRIMDAITVLSSETAKTLGGGKLLDLTKQLEDSVGDIVMTLTTKGYSRRQEYEADAAALLLLRRAGFSEQSMITMLRRMDRHLVQSGGLGFAKTHPSPMHRIRTLQKMVFPVWAQVNEIRQKRFADAMEPVLY